MLILTLKPQSQESGSPDHPTDLMGKLDIRVGDTSFYADSEPVISFLNEFHGALIHSIIFGIPSQVLIFSENVTLRLQKSEESSDRLTVQLFFSCQEMASSNESVFEVANIFREMTSNIVEVLRSSLSYEEITEALSTSIIPLNEGFLPTFLRRSYITKEFRGHIT